MRKSKLSIRECLKSLFRLKGSEDRKKLTDQRKWVHGEAGQRTSILFYEVEKQRTSILFYEGIDRAGSLSRLCGQAAEYW